MGKLFRTRRDLELAAAATTLIGLIALIVLVEQLVPEPPRLLPDDSSVLVEVFPDFAAIGDVDVKKQQFFDYLEDFVNAENARIVARREELSSRVDIVGTGVGLSQRERQWMLEMAEEYEVDTELSSERQILQELVRRVDVIPPSLALAQAATESAWGTSRFTLEGNNLFGQWCYSEGCGMVPQQRPSGEIYEVQRFDSVESSVAAYIHNLNTHHLYEGFRRARERMWRNSGGLDSYLLAFQLGRYSERGEYYIDEIQTIIQQNGLKARDQRSGLIH